MKKQPRVSIAQILWRIFRIALLPASIGLAVYFVARGAPIAEKTVYSSDEMLAVSHYADWLAGIILLLLATTIVQMVFLASYRYALDNTKDEDEKTYAKRLLSFEIPFIIIFHVIALGITLYILHILRDWPLTSPGEPSPLMYILGYLAIATIPTLFRLANKWFPPASRTA